MQPNVRLLTSSGCLSALCTWQNGALENNPQPLIKSIPTTNFPFLGDISRMGLGFWWGLTRSQSSKTTYHSGYDVLRLGSGTLSISLPPVYMLSFHSHAPSLYYLGSLLVYGTVRNT
jgi:hypothetical protein